MCDCPPSTASSNGSPTTGPADLFWPAELPRPAPSPDSPAAQARAANLANDLNADGEIANLAAWCRRNAYEPNDARSVIRRYGAGGSPGGPLSPPRLRRAIRPGATNQNWRPPLCHLSPL